MRWFVVLFHFAVTSTYAIRIRCHEWLLQNPVMEKATQTSLNVAWYFVSQDFNNLANTLVVQNRRFGPPNNGVHEWGKYCCQHDKLTFPKGPRWLAITWSFWHTFGNWDIRILGRTSTILTSWVGFLSHSRPVVINMCAVRSCQVRSEMEDKNGYM
jgi:hypothetical protein